MAPDAELIVVALQAVLHAYGRDAIAMIRTPLPGVTLRPALMTFRAVSLDPAMAFLAISRILLLDLAMDHQPVGRFMVFRHRFLRMASGTGVTRFLTVMTFIADGHRRFVAGRGSGVVNKVSVTVHAPQAA